MRSSAVRLGLGAIMAVVGMAGCAYHTPTESQPIPVGVRNPSLIVIDFVSGTGTKAGTATITARVLNSLGDALVGESVSFTTDTGSLSPAVAVTDKDGKSATALTASISAHVKATVGSLSTESPIAIQPAPTAGSPAPGIATATM